MRRAWALPWLAAALAAAGGPACGGDDNETPEQKVCRQACARLAGCGVATQGSCASDCVRLPAYVTCLQEGPSTCNDIALCAYAAACGGVRPSGTGTCGTAAICADGCEQSGVDCSCACAAALAPARALNLLIRTSCAEVKCPGACGITSQSGQSCDACYQQECTSANMQCLNQ
jgi:hypothetical protein